MVSENPNQRLRLALMARTGRQLNNVRVSSPRLSINGDIKLRLECRLCANVIEGELHEKQARTGVLTTAWVYHRTPVPLEAVTFNDFINVIRL